MISVRRCWLIVVLAVGLAGCSTISVSTDYDTSRDFAALKRFTWMAPQQKLVVDPLVDNDLMGNRIRQSVITELKARGYVQAGEGEGADFFITYHVTAEDKISATTFHGSYGYYPCWQGCGGLTPGFDADVIVQQYKQGTFMLDVIDPASEKLMWRGIAEKRLTSGTPGERDEAVRAIVSAILSRFPPAVGQ